MQFTVKTTASVKLEGKTERIVFDDDIKGFGLRLREGGSRTWIYQYRIGSKQRRMVLGSAKSVPLSVARENAGRLEARVKLGGDPAMDKETARRSADETVGVLVDQYLAARQSKWRPNTEREVRRHLTKYAKSLHRFPISAVSQLNISNLQFSVDNAQHHLPLYWHVSAPVSQLCNGSRKFSWDLHMQYVNGNPVKIERANINVINSATAPTTRVPKGYWPHRATGHRRHRGGQTESGPARRSEVSSRHRYRPERARRHRRTDRLTSANRRDSVTPPTVKCLIF